MKKAIVQKSLKVSVTTSTTSSMSNDVLSPGSEKKNVHFAEGENLVNIKTFVPSCDDLDALRKVFLNQHHHNIQSRRIDEDNCDGKNAPGNSPSRFEKVKDSTHVLAKRTVYMRTMSYESECLSACYDDLVMDEIEKRVKCNNICLAHTRLNGRNVSGFITVKNLAYQKRVFVRYTFDAWKTVLDAPAFYVSKFDDDGTKDKFGFTVNFPSDKTEMLFALRYCVCEKEYWDNNGGNNYKIVNFH